MKIIFLDIDGVMNSLDEIQASYHENNNHRVYDVDMPSPKHTKCLKEIIARTGARIVLSSSWRVSLRTVQHLIDWFDKDGITIYGYTCESVYKSELRGTKYENIKPYSSRPTDFDFREPGYRGTIIDDRGAEIAWWLICHPQVESYVILDDDSADIKQWHPNNFVETNTMTGLLPIHVEKAIKILGEK